MIKSHLPRVLVWRLLQALPVAAMSTLAIFGLIQLVPGDPAATIAGEYATAETIEAIRQTLGLDRPLWEQYGVWLWNAFQGDLSTSLLTGLPVIDEIARRLPSTLLIAGLALVISIIVGVPLGIIAATRADGWVDRVVTSIASLGVVHGDNCHVAPMFDLDDFAVLGHHRFLICQ